MDLFPHEQIRPEQEKLLNSVRRAVNEKRNLIVHAPTGLGKTAATISPVLEYALEKNLTVFYLTSRHTQHRIVIDTLRKIKETHRVAFTATDMIGKKNMCSMPGAQLMHSSDFSDYCKSAREKGSCSFYELTKKGNALTFDGKALISELMLNSPINAEDAIGKCISRKLCAYYLSLALAEKSQIIIGDYNLIFNPSIRTKLLGQVQKKLDQCIIIVDEAHNLPDRIRNNMSTILSSPLIKAAIHEAKSSGANELIPYLNSVQEILNNLAGNCEGKEDLVERFEIMSKLKGYDEIIESLEAVAEGVRIEKKRSFLGSVSKFLQDWKGPDDGFARILTISDKAIKLSYKCLDPSIVSEPVIKEAHSTIFMSGTMNPTEMYKEVLGIDRCGEEEYASPFPKKNKLSLIVPMTTTKFTARNEMQFRNIAVLCSKIIELIPGNCAVFFPSYQMKDDISKHLSVMTKKTVFSEVQRMTKQEKAEFLEKFKSYNNAVMLAVASGSFGEGIDLPGVLKGIVIVGLPLKPPDLETKKTMEYYQELFGKGWDYGYIFPAINKALQAAGRCIRSEKDRGVIVFLDERYEWPNYRRCFPDNYVTSLNFEREIKEFWDNQITKE